MGWVVKTTLRPLYPRKDPVPVALEAVWAPGPVWTGAENLAPPTGIRSPDRPAPSESLYRLSYPGPIIRLKLIRVCFTEFLRYSQCDPAV